jgi:hypothetical protein
LIAIKSTSDLLGEKSARNVSPDFLAVSGNRQNQLGLCGRRDLEITKFVFAPKVVKRQKPASGLGAFEAEARALARAHQV